MDGPQRRSNAMVGRHGIYDLSGLHVSHHALDRYRERIAIDPTADISAAIVADRLKACRKLGTRDTGASAYLVAGEGEPFVLIVSGDNVTTILSVEQFASVMADFGRPRWPRRFGRWLRRIGGESKHEDKNGSER